MKFKHKIVFSIILVIHGESEGKMKMANNYDSNC